MKKRVASLLAAFILSVSPTLFAQLQPPYEQAIAGYAGELTIIPNESLHVVTVELVPKVNGQSVGQPLVYVLQGDFYDYPERFSGPGRLLVGKTYVGLIQGTSENEKLESYTFANRVLAPQIDRIKTKTRTIMGIAQYGSSIPLTEAQFLALAQSGSVTADRTTPRFLDPKMGIELNNGSAKTAQITPEYANPCASGGRVYAMLCPIRMFCYMWDGLLMLCRERKWQ